MVSNAHDTHAACSPNCTYRSLYEGTQASLTDMAARQSQALGRVGRLRSAVISAMKAARPGRFAEIEQRSKLRVQDGDDLFVVAVLEHVLREQTNDASRENLVELREALRPWGIQLIGEDMTAWVHQLRGQMPRTQAAKAGVERAATVSFAQAARERQEQSVSSWESAANLGVSELVKRIAVSGSDPDAKTWMDLPKEEVATGAGKTRTSRVGPASNNGAAEKAHLDVDELFAPTGGTARDTERATEPTPSGSGDRAAGRTEATGVAAVDAVKPATVPDVEDEGSATTTSSIDAQSGGPLTVESVQDDIFAVDNDDVIDGPSDDFGAISSDEDDQFSEAFDEDDEPTPVQDEPSDGTPPADIPGSSTTSDNASTVVQDTAAEAVQVKPAVEQNDGWIKAFPTSDDSGTRNTEPTPSLPPKAPVQVPGHEEGGPSTATDHSAPAEIETPGASSATQQVVDTPEKPRRKVAPSAPVRVELFPHTTPQRPSGTRKRKPKKSALPPEAFSTDGIVQSGLSPKTRSQLLSVCLTPRPVFSGDLADLVGDVSIVEEWQEETYSNGSMRFIDAKSRHRQLGSLAIPHGDTRKLAGELEKSWWGASMERYRGAKLYELGVVGRKLGTSVRSWHVDPVHPVVSLRVNAERGLQGVIIVCDDELEDGSMGRRGVVSEIETMMREPLEIMYVLATGDKTLDPLVSAVEEEARRRGWKAPCSVVCARSWEWADGSGPLIAVL